MRRVAICHTEMAQQLTVLRAAVSSITWSVLGRFPSEAFRVEVVDEMLADFWEQAEWCSHRKNSGMRVCDPILGPPSGRVRLANCLEEAIEGGGGLQVEL
jgi:hypothetical protein